jgi:solute carrier family 25 citrate transporter 1
MCNRVACHTRTRVAPPDSRARAGCAPPSLAPLRSFPCPRPFFPRALLLRALAVKTQLQLFDDKAKLGPLQCARDTVRKDGVLGLYRGLSSLLFFSVPKVATRFLAFEQLKGALAGPDGRLSTPATLLCGLGAGVAEAIVAVTPMDTIKTRLIHDQLTRAPHERAYRGLAHGVVTIVRADGLGGVYKGLTATILKQGSNQAIRWLVFTRAKEAMAGGPDTSKLGVLHTVAASVAAGAASVYGNTPVDVIKTRMQGLSASKYKGVVDCATQIARNEGFRGFYKGATARLARVCLDVTIIMVLYEQISKVLDRVWVENV